MTAIACTGFVSEQSGSVAAANALLLRALLTAGFNVDFFSKPSFVDPRPAVGSHSNFRFVPVNNRSADAFRRIVANIGLLGLVAGQYDAFSYNRLLVRRIQKANAQHRYDAV